MSVFLNKNTKVLVQGITGTQASFHTQKMVAYGTKIVAGVSPNRGGTKHLGVDVYNSTIEAVKATKATASVMFVPARFVKDAIKEAVEAELETVVVIASGVPIKDMMEIKAMLKGSKTLLIGPNTPGIITPDEACLGIFPENIHKKGNIGVVSRSSTLTYEAVIETTRAGMGQSTVIGLGDDMIVGTDFVEIIKKFHEDNNTKAILMIGRQGGMYEETGAEYYAGLKYKKPIIGYIAGSTISTQDKMGYAGDIITRGKITTESKKETLQKAGIMVADSINRIHQLLENLK
ncbi:MAG: succinate--CoA ligase subunit alpha [Alphaproteobacteria bacterium]|nr:succinate--CoA ligase subunit alpha [Alphaproteobacteria bacterium]